MEEEIDIDNKIIHFMNEDRRRDYTIPEIMSGVSIKSREKITTCLARLQARNIIEVSRQKGRTNHYHLK